MLALALALTYTFHVITPLPLVTREPAAMTAIMPRHTHLTSLLALDAEGFKEAFGQLVEVCGSSA